MSTVTDGVRAGRVVLLGKHGFVARALGRHLQSLGIPVEALGKDDVDLTQAGAVEALGAQLRETDAVVVTATLTPDKGRDVRTLMKNLTMAAHLCDALDRRPCAHVVYLSSDAVYTADEMGLTEASAREPVDLYAVMHTAREMMLGSVLAARQVPYCVLRPVNIYGHGDTHNSYGPNRFIRQAFAERKIAVFGKGEERRCHLYIADAVRLIGASLTRRLTGTFNMASPEVVTFMDVVEMIRAACPFPIDVEFKPRSAPGAVTHRTYAVGPLRDAVPGFPFTPMPEAIRDYARMVQDARDDRAAAGGGRG